MTRQNISSGTPWEAKFGYSRAVRVDDRVLLSGTIAVDSEGTLQHAEDPRGQAQLILDRIESALEQADASLGDLVSLRTYITRMEDADSIGLVFKERLQGINPTSTMVVVSRLFAGARVEIEAEAIVGSGC